MVQQQKLNQRQRLEEEEDEEENRRNQKRNLLFRVRWPFLFLDGGWKKEERSEEEKNTTLFDSLLLSFEKLQENFLLSQSFSFSPKKLKEMMCSIDI